MVETGSAREVHHFALLAATAPRRSIPTALESLGKMSDPEKAVKNFVKAIGKGLNKVMSKMGISTYMSYTGAQIFEAVGLQKALVDKYFTGTASNIEGIGIFQVAEEALRQHRAAFGNDPVCQRPRSGRRIRLPRARRRAHVDAGFHRQAAARLAPEQLPHVQGVRADHQRPEPSP